MHSKNVDVVFVEFQIIEATKIEKRPSEVLDDFSFREVTYVKTIHLKLMTIASTVFVYFARAMTYF